MTVAMLLVLIAVILFIIGAIGVNTGKVNVISAGLAFFAASFLVGVIH